MSMPRSSLTTGDDAFVRQRRFRAMREQAPVTAVIALGGAAGAGARYGVDLAWPTVAGGFPWATLTVNVTGCALMGMVMVAITELWVGHRLLRPLLGTGVLGGYTTFSTFAGEVENLADAGHPDRAALYLTLTPVAVLLATWTATGLTQRLLTRRTS